MKRNLLLIIVCLLLAQNTEAKQIPHRKGYFRAVFNERSPLSKPAAIAHRMREKVSKEVLKNNYEITDETFDVYVPADYNSQMPYGLLVWVSPGDKGKIPKGWHTLMDKHKLIWVGADKSGNKTNLRGRRIPLVLDAAYNMQKLYNIDPNRVYLAGSSGGGRVASVMAFHFSDVFDGAIFIIGANYWQKMKIPNKKGYFWPSACRKPRSRFLNRAKNHCRYVFLTGDNDSNREQMHTYYKKGYSKILNNVRYIQVPKMGHERPPVEWLEKAIEFLDRPPIVPMEPTDKNSPQPALQ